MLVHIDLNTNEKLLLCKSSQILAITVILNFAKQFDSAVVCLYEKTEDDFFNGAYIAKLIYEKYNFNN